MDRNERPSEPAAVLLRLLAWLSPAFPTGAFAYSHGLEWAVESGDVRDGATLQEWLEDVLRHGAGRTDAILLRHAHACEDVAALGRAVPASRERLAETVGQGDAFVRAAEPWRALTPAPSQSEQHGVPIAVAIGALTGRHGIDPDLACAAMLQAFTANLIFAAVRLVPLGQSVGLAVLAALEPSILAVAEETRGAALADIGGCAWRSDIAAMRHETQHTRLFRS
jgi:urease accessory protein